MKTLLQTSSRFALLAALIGLGFSHAAQAQVVAASAPAYVSKVSDNVYVLRISNPAQQKGQVQIVRLRDGAKLYQRFSAAPSFGMKLNVRDLVGDRYEFVVTLGQKTYRYPLNLAPEAYQPITPALVASARPK
ncbi:hypothetical protein LRS06_10490 [Hymenobacter sp. J193]|uniref:hypothetical protein n=1 Tax=Hymenobacter sp. J193 TaxID=2898429 RepID=UPI002151475D|nr:hypothetical protein [Hymenobacter sp. J193]MCR5888184.1 hypothetical protein [Hymenobacter sp. J193]